MLFQGLQLLQQVVSFGVQVQELDLLISLVEGFEHFNQAIAIILGSLRSDPYARGTLNAFGGGSARNNSGHQSF